ncbi:MAG: aldehyde dehydrogenase family protein [Actinobacteria bacterium]|nr:aldehyde dehydrogenase family protein [Actinomycetota bacterium]
MAQHHQLYVDGEWVDGAMGATFDSYNPYTGEVFARVAAGEVEDLNRAIAAADAALPAWAGSSPAYRAELFLRAANVLEEMRDEFVQTFVEEQGAAKFTCNFQVNFAGMLMREAAAQAHDPIGQILPSDTPGAFFMTKRQPAGVVAGIAPWNGPLLLGLRAVTLPMVYGNTTILKPSSETPVVGGALIAKLFERAGFPKGVVNVVWNGPGKSGEFGEAIMAHPRVRRVNFTGSTDVGRELGILGGKYLKRVALELGGKDPCIILRDADMDTAVNATCFGKFMGSGQGCMAVERIIVEQPIGDEFIDRFVKKASSLKVGDPREDDTGIGPLINRRQLERVKTQVEEAVRDGAKIMCGGRYEGLSYWPTVLTDVKRNMRVMREETFGPVAPVIVVKDVEEAIEVANDNAYGLSCGIITRDLQKGLAIADRIESGMVHINESSTADEPHVPFGGVKDSGWGKMGGKQAAEEFTELRWITFQTSPRQYPL